MYPHLTENDPANRYLTGKKITETVPYLFFSKQKQSKQLCVIFAFYLLKVLCKKYIFCFCIVSLVKKVCFLDYNCFIK